MIQNVWELTDYGFNESRDSNSGQTEEENKEKSNNTASSHSKDAILSGGNVASFIGGLDGLKAQGIEMNMASMDREARHLRKYLYQRRVKTGKFDNVIEELGTGWDPESLKNWLLLGNLMTIMVSDVI